MDTHFDTSAFCPYAGDPLLEILAAIDGRPCTQEVGVQEEGRDERSWAVLVEALGITLSRARQHSLSSLRHGLCRNAANLTIVGCYLTLKHLFWEDLRDRAFPFGWNVPVPEIMRCGSMRHWDLDWEQKCREEWRVVPMDLSGTVGELTREFWHKAPHRTKLQGIGKAPSCDSALADSITMIRDCGTVAGNLDEATCLSAIECQEMENVWDFLSRRYLAYFGVPLPSREPAKRSADLGIFKMTYADYAWPACFQTLGDLARYISRQQPSICPWPY